MVSPPEPAEERYLLPFEAAKLLHVTRKTVDRWASAGRIPSIATLGGHRRFRLDDIMAVAERMRAPQPAGSVVPPREGGRSPDARLSL